MSMISGQIDKLRETANRLDSIADISTPWIHSHLTPMLRQAADLILELRDDLQRVNAENDKFIVKLNAEHIVRRNVEIENAKLRDDLEFANNEWEKDSLEYLNLQAENAKLRELVRKYGEYIDQDRCEGCVYKSRCNEGYIEECWQRTEIRKLARELGVDE